MNLDLSQNAIIALCVIGGIFIIFNLALFAIARNRIGNSQLKATQDRLRTRIRNPWQDEDDGLSELSQRVSGLHPGDEQPPRDTHD